MPGFVDPSLLGCSSDGSKSLYTAAWPSCDAHASTEARASEQARIYKSQSGEGGFATFADQVARNASVTGSRAARSAGNNPPIKPMPNAHFKPLHKSSGETLNWNTTWLKFAPNVATL